MKHIGRILSGTLALLLLGGISILAIPGWLGTTALTASDINESRPIIITLWVIAMMVVFLLGSVSLGFKHHPLALFGLLGVCLTTTAALGATEHMAGIVPAQIAASVLIASDLASLVVAVTIAWRSRAVGSHRKAS